MTQQASRHRHWLRLFGVMCALALAATSCRIASDELVADSIAGSVTDSAAADSLGSPSAPPGALPRPLTVDAITCSTSDEDTGLTEAGAELLASQGDLLATMPRYELAVDIDPATGDVAGAMRATVPAQSGELNFRVFAGMDAFDADLTIDNVTINGQPTDFLLDRALLTVPPHDSSDAATSTVELDFRYGISQMAANESLFGGLTGSTLQPDQVGLLGRTESGMQLGHWFPVWLPDGTRTDPDPSGFGDIGAFPAARICSTITVPPTYKVVTSGTSVNVTDESFVEAAHGLRDFSILVSNDLDVVSDTVDGVAVRVWGPADDPEALATVLDYSVQSQQALVDAFGPYPWTEIDIVSAPLGGGVGGMEWPGMVWVERSMFGGGLPGLGDFGDLFEDADLDLDSMLGGFGGIALTTTLEWTVAHELGHEWWHATVGNDSIESPAVDEPLAQFAACIAMQTIHPDNWRAICEAQTIDQFAQARALGVSDGIAERPSDDFDSSLQYGAVIYGKAPGFYLEAADLIGWDPLVAALRSFVQENAFMLVSTDVLRSHLIEAAGTDGDQIAALWDRWFRATFGDEDIEPSDLFGGLGGLGNLEGLEGLEGLQGLEGLERLEGLDLEGLDLGDLDLENLDMENLLEELDLETMLEDLLEALDE